MINGMMDFFGIDNVRYLGKVDKTANGTRYIVYKFEYVGEKPDHCSICGEPLYRNGTRDITLLATPMQGLPADYLIKYPRYRCKGCGTTVVPTITGTSLNHRCTENAYLAIAEKCLTNSFEEVAMDYHASTNTIKNIFLEYFHEHEKFFKFNTPAFLGVSEVNLGRRGHALILSDLEHGTVYDICPQMNESQFSEYLSRIENISRISWVCLDWKSSYFNILKKALPNITFVLDHFSIVSELLKVIDEVVSNLRLVKSKVLKQFPIDDLLIKMIIKKTCNLSFSESDILRNLRNHCPNHPVLQLFDLKEDFLNIWTDNHDSRYNAEKSFELWKSHIPYDDSFEPLRVFSDEIEELGDTIFSYWDCPIVLNNAFAKSVMAIIAQINSYSRGYSLDILRLKILYKGIDLKHITANGISQYGPNLK